jgi:heme exporter protein A
MTDSKETTGSGQGSHDLVVDAREVSKRYARTWALRQVNLEVAEGELVSLLGPNGSGKSTLIRVLTASTRPTFGEVRIFGQPPKNGQSARERMGVLPHQSFLYDELTALENLRFAATMYGIVADKDRMVEALAHVGLEHVAGAQTRTFSSGMRKRLALARATLHDPDLVILDEPYGALDVEGIGWVDRFIAEQRDAKKTVVIATHEIGRALALCDRAVQLRGGRVMFNGPTSEYEGAVSGATAAVGLGMEGR